MQIYAKASLHMEEITEKIRCGCDGLELNLTRDFYELGKDFLKNYPSGIFHMKNIEVVHTPSDKYHQMMNLERVFLKDDVTPLENVFRMSQYLAEYWKHRIKVVIHSSISMYELMEYELLRKRIEKFFIEWFALYPDVDLLIENVVPIEYKIEDPFPVRLCNGLLSDTTEIVNYYRESFGKRVGSVLDICHTMMTQTYMELLLNGADFFRSSVDEIQLSCHEREFFDYGIGRAFNLNKDICELIHFNNLMGNGYGINHGVGFERQEEVNCILDLYRQFNYKCPLTLEIREDDYENCVNYRQTKAMIDTWLQRA